MISRLNVSNKLLLPPFESIWSIRIVNPTRTIEHCALTLELSSDASRYFPLAVWNKKQVYVETKIAKGGAANFRIPKTVNTFGMLVVVKDRGRGF